MKDEIKKALLDLKFTEEQAEERANEVMKCNFHEAREAKVWVKGDKVRIYMTHRDNRNNGSWIDVVNMTSEAKNGKSIEYQVLGRIIGEAKIK